MTREDFVAKYPMLFHMAHGEAWDSIQQHGLLSTSSLLDLYEICGEERERIESMHRPNSVVIRHPQYGTAVIRDQKPMSQGGVEKAVSDCSPGDWFRLLNSLVFLWPTQDRLKRMRDARAYRGQSKCIISVDTQRFFEKYFDQVLLSPINSGATKPFPHPRTKRETFRSFLEYDFEGRRRKAGIANVVAEVAVAGSIPDFASFVTGIELLES